MRTINQLPAVLLERGITLAKGRAVLMRRLEEVGSEGLAVSDRTRRLVEDLLEECDGLSRRIKAYDDELAAVVRSDEQARRLSSIPWVGVINATALLAAVGDGSAFAKARDLAS